MREKTSDDLTILAAIVFVVFVNLCAWSMLADGDTPWHIATGNWILDHRAIPVVDPFSSTAAGKPWHTHEWLAELLMALVWRGAGWSGITLLYALSGAALVLLLGIELRRWLSPFSLFAALCLVFAVLQPFVLARPHALAWPLLAFWTIALLRAREKGEAPPIPVALVMALWANIHGSFLVGLGLLAAITIEALLESEDRRRALRQWAPFLLLAATASLLTPYGFRGLIYPLQVSGMSALPLITEWRPASFDRPSGFEVALLVALFVLLLRGVKVPVVRLALLLALLHLALTHVRHQPIFAIVAVLLAVEALARALRPDAATLQTNPFTPLRRARPLLLLLATGLLLTGALRLATPMERPNGPDSPESAVTAMPVEWRRWNGFNGYGFGGLLILHGFRPFIDGRADLYGDRFMFAHQEIMAGDRQAWNHAVARWKLRWAIVPPGTPIAENLRRDPHWTKTYGDHWALVFHRGG